MNAVGSSCFTYQPHLNSRHGWSPRADFFTLAVRTGKAGPGGISLLLVDAKTPGFRVRNGGGSWVKFGDDLGRGWGLTPVDVGFFSGGIWDELGVDGS